MTDDDALEILKADIRKLFPPGPVRERWLAWADRIQRATSGGGRLCGTRRVRLVGKAAPSGSVGPHYSARPVETSPHGGA